MPERLFRSRSCCLSFVWLRHTARPDGCTSATTYGGQSKLAVVIILQSQLHRVNGRSASGDVTISPLSSTVDVWEWRRSCVQRNGRDQASLYHKSVRVEWKTRSPSPCTPLNAFGIPSGPGTFSLCVASISSNSCLSIIVIENGLVRIGPFIIGTCFKDTAPVSLTRLRHRAAFLPHL